MEIENQPEQDAVDLTAIEAKKKLDDAVRDLEKAAIGTQLAPALSFNLLMVQVDALVQVLADSGALDRVAFWTKVTENVEAMAVNCRRAVLTAGKLIETSKGRN